MPKLGVNIDHIATLRQARREFDPDPVRGAHTCEQAGADSIVAHLREDRRHINDADIQNLKKTVRTRFNMELSLDPEIIQIACRVHPDQATIVPERRQEITTEGGLDVVKYFKRVQEAARRLEGSGIEVSLFIAPDKKQIDKSKEAGAKLVELHTGHYALAQNQTQLNLELKKIKEAAHYAHQRGLIVNAGHGLNYHNTKPIAQIPGINELNIGHAIMARAIFVGLEAAVKEMLKMVRHK